MEIIPGGGGGLVRRGSSRRRTGTHGGSPQRQRRRGRIHGGGSYKRGGVGGGDTDGEEGDSCSVTNNRDADYIEMTPLMSSATPFASAGSGQDTSGLLPTARTSSSLPVVVGFLPHTSGSSTFSTAQYIDAIRVDSGHDINATSV